MLKLGYHASFARGYLAMGKEAIAIDANAIQFFSRNPRGGAARAFDENDARALRDFLVVNNFAPLLIHAPYTLNACAADADLRKFAVAVLLDDLQRAAFFPAALYNLHPGSHVQQGREIGVKLIAEALNTVLEKSSGKNLILLETMAGKGSEVGRSFTELRDIIALLKDDSRIGITLDTCHLFSAGYDVVNSLDKVIADFDAILGLKKLHAVHLNDSMTAFGEHKDRHAKIGEGKIGLTALTAIITHKKLRRLPFYLETPNEVAGYAAEIKLLRATYANC